MKGILETFEAAKSSHQMRCDRPFAGLHQGGAREIAQNQDPQAPILRLPRFRILPPHSRNSQKQVRTCRMNRPGSLYVFRGTRSGNKRCVHDTSAVQQAGLLQTCLDVRKKSSRRDGFPPANVGISKALNPKIYWLANRQGHDGEFDSFQRENFPPLPKGFEQGIRLEPSWKMEETRFA